MSQKSLYKAWQDSSMRERLLEALPAYQADENSERVYEMVQALWLENQRLTRGDRLRTLLRNHVCQFGGKIADEDLRFSMTLEFEDRETKGKFWSILYDLTESGDDIEEVED